MTPLKEIYTERVKMESSLEMDYTIVMAYKRLSNIAYISGKLKNHICALLKSFKETTHII